MAVYAVGRISGAHLNPAVTIALATIGSFPWAEVPGYIAAQMVGAFAGAVIVWLAYLPHWRVTADPGTKLAVFATGPAIRHTAAQPDRPRSSARRRCCSASSRSPPTRRRCRSRATSTCRSSSAAACSRCSSASSCSASACRSAARPATPSIRRAISGRASRTPSCRSPARALRLGVRLDPGRRPDHRRHAGAGLYSIDRILNGGFQRYQCSESGSGSSRTEP